MRNPSDSCVTPAQEESEARLQGGVIRKEVGATMRLAGPVVVTQLGMMTMGLVDILMVGPLGPEALAAVSLGNAVYFAIVIFFGGIIMALDTMVSQAIGAGMRDRVGALLWQGVWLGIALGVMLNLLFLDLEWLLIFLRQEENIARMAGEYMSARSYAALPFLVFAATRSLLNGLGDTRPVMIVTILANIVNVVADAVLIHGLLGAPELGVIGAGAATSMVRWFMLLAMILVLRSARYNDIPLYPQPPDMARIRRLVILGVPIGGQLLAEVGVFSATGILVGWLGSTALAQHQIALTCVSFAFMVPLGIGLASNVRVGHAIGRGDHDGAMRAGKVGMAIGVGFMVLPSVMFLVMPALLARAFTSDPVVIAGTVTLLKIAVIFQLADGLQAVAAGCLRGAGDTKTPLYSNLFSHWVVGLPLGSWLAFGLGWGTKGLWWGLTLALLIAGSSLAWIFLRGFWRHRKSAL